MTPTDLRAWQAHMGYTYATAADALGVNRSTYANWLQDTNRASGQPTVIDKRTALACAALAAGISEWSVDTA